MSKAGTVSCLLVAAVIAFAGGAAEHFVTLPRGVLPGVVLLAVMLLSYPAVRRWYGARREVTFTRWALTSMVATVTATVIYLAVAVR